MSQPNPAAEREAAIEEMKLKNPNLTNEEVQEMLDELFAESV